MTENAPTRLLDVLVQAGVISQAQADLALIDADNMSMSLDEVLLARHWVTQENLQTHAPWLFEKSGGASLSDTSEFTRYKGSSDDYGANLARYRSLMRDILGDG